MSDRKHMDIGDFELVLQELNRKLLHPIGLEFTCDVDDETGDREVHLGYHVQPAGDPE